jgi:hypothetical protein
MMSESVNKGGYPGKIRRNNPLKTGEEGFKPNRC